MDFQTLDFCEYKWERHPGGQPSKKRTPSKIAADRVVSQQARKVYRKEVAEVVARIPESERAQFWAQQKKEKKEKEKVRRLRAQETEHALALQKQAEDQLRKEAVEQAIAVLKANLGLSTPEPDSGIASCKCYSQFSSAIRH